MAVMLVKETGPKQDMENTVYRRTGQNRPGVRMRREGMNTVVIYAP